MHACKHAQSLSHVRLLATLWTVDHKAPLSMELSRQKYWTRVLLHGIFLTKGSNLHLLCLLQWQADSLPLPHLGSSWRVHI